MGEHALVQEVGMPDEYDTVLNDDSGSLVTGSNGTIVE